MDTRRSEFVLLQPRSRHTPKGYTHGVVVPRGGRMVFVAGQLASNQDGVITSRDFVAQFATCLDNVIAIVKEANGRPESIAQLTIYITDFDAYRHHKQALAVAWHARFADFYPAIEIVSVKELIDRDAMVEIGGIACLPE